MKFARVIVDVPLDHPLDYRVGDAGPDGPAIGMRCVVPVGTREAVGIVVGFADQTAIDERRLRELGRTLGEPVLPASWLALTRFAADYYHHPWGEVALPALPRLLRAPPGRHYARQVARAREHGPPGPAPSVELPPPLRDEQAAAIEAIAATRGFAPFLLYGITGSGKTEVYLGAIARMLAADARAQALFLVPEINLTPQLEARLRARFPQHAIVSLHSGLTESERAAAWLQAHEGRARVVLGTRMAVFAPLPGLALVVVDEEHDPSLKASEGLAYSARDLAVKRAQLERVAVVLGSATPSLESWHQAGAGRYRLLRMSERAAPGPHADPRIEPVDLRIHAPLQGLAAPLRAALEQTLARAEQSLVFINRRGYAPVLACDACGWLSNCPHCESFAAFHKTDGGRGSPSLRCHHCGWSRRLPAACPTCGNQDLAPVGQGTQRVEEALCAAWPQARVARIDRDTTRRAHAARRALEAVHAGDVDILVGTQMIAKGHDFRRVSTVAVLNADAQLVAPDFRAPERLFALLMQVAGRAGRGGQASRVLIQTRFPAHPLFAALARHDYAEFARTELAERRSAKMPPFVYQALLTAHARTLEAALEFLRECRRMGLPAAQAQSVELYEAVPMPLARLASESRAQLLIESTRRRALHAFLDTWLAELRRLRPRGGLRWRLEMDPMSI
jgi:primosomal protein N' (replication factor Y)